MVEAADGHTHQGLVKMAGTAVLPWSEIALFVDAGRANEGERMGMDTGTSSDEDERTEKRP